MSRINRIYVQGLKLCFDATQINCEFSLMFVVIKVKKKSLCGLLEIMKYNGSK